MSSTTTVTLKPTAGFCIKSTTLQPAVYVPKQPPTPANANLLEPQTVPAQIALPAGFKVFVNIAWDPNVPPPPEADEEAIQRAMQGEDLDNLSSDGWYVPVVVSDGRQDRDKAGKPALVFDCVFNNGVRSRTVHDQDFKFFIVELALQRLEDQAKLTLSRQIGTPNIASKGPLAPRTISVPTVLLSPPKSTKEGSSPLEITPGNGSSSGTKAKGKSKALIEEVDSTAVQTKKEPLRGILKKPTGGTKSTPAAAPTPNSASKPTPLSWTWESTPTGRIEVTIQVPDMTHTLIAQTTLDIEPRRIILQLPPLPSPSPSSQALPSLVDINLQLSDAEIVATLGNAIAGTLEPGSKGYLMLKRQREFDVDGAVAEWRVGEGVLVVRA